MLSPLLPEEFPPAGPRVQRPSSHGRDFKASAVRGSDTVPLGRRNTVPRCFGESPHASRGVPRLEVAPPLVGLLLRLECQVVTTPLSRPSTPPKAQLLHFLPVPE